MTDPLFPGQVVVPPTPIAADTGLVGDPAAAPVVEETDPSLGNTTVDPLDVPAGGLTEEDILEPELFVDPLDPVVTIPELGDMPADPTAVMENPVILDADDEDIYENDDILGESKIFEVKKAFRLPENRSIVICRGDKISLVGKAKPNAGPKFAESTFSKALNKLTESKKGTLAQEGALDEKVALVGHSCLFEVSKDWKLPGSNLILEAGEIYQVLGKGKLREEADPDEKKKDDEEDKKDGDKNPFAKKDDDEKKKEDDDKKKDESTLRTSKVTHGVHFGVTDRY